ncbi:pentapeptide repeat-containing protein, partial [Campylobacter jejuni]
MDFVKFINCIFYKQFTICSIIDKKADFSNSHFKDYADFHACEFEKTANFYRATFDKTPNFSQVIFKGNLNVVNTNLNFTFYDLQDKIKQEYE